jgi:hypothetical protein
VRVCCRDAGDGEIALCLEATGILMLLPCGPPLAMHQVTAFVKCQLPHRAGRRRSGTPLRPWRQKQNVVPCPYALADLLRFTKQEIEVAAGDTTQVRMTFDANGAGGAGAGAGAGTHDLLVFVDDPILRRVEECFRVVLRIT